MYEYKADLIRVIDGDTYWFMVDLGLRVYHKDKFRLLGVDTPEIYGRNTEPERGGAASQFVKDWFAKHGNQALIRTHAALTRKGDEKKTLDRWLAEVYSPDGKESLAQAIQDGGHTK